MTKRSDSDIEGRQIGVAGTGILTKSSTTVTDLDNCNIGVAGAGILPRVCTEFEECPAQLTLSCIRPFGLKSSFGGGGGDGGDVGQKAQS